MESQQPLSERLFAERYWRQCSLRTLFIAVAVASGWLSWEAYRAEQRASVGVALRRLGADASMVVRQPRWLWTLFGERLGQTITYVGVGHEKVELAIPYLKALPDLEEVAVNSTLPRLLTIAAVRSVPHRSLDKLFRAPLSGLSIHTIQKHGMETGGQGTSGRAGCGPNSFISFCCGKADLGIARIGSWAAER